jgi:Bacterial Ig-like domain (group 3)
MGITDTQSYSLVIRDTFFDAVAALAFFSTFTKRKSKQLQIQPQDLPYLGVYIVDEQMTPDGDANAGDVRFIHTLRIGFSVIIQNNDPVSSEIELDKSFWAIMHRLWPDQYIMNMLDTRSYPGGIGTPDNTRVEGIVRGTRRHLWGNNTLSNEMPVAELQYDVSCTYRSTWPPIIVDELDTIITTTELGDPPDSVQHITSVYDFTETHPPYETEVSLESLKDPSVFGEQVVFMAVVSSINSSGGLPQGTVGFRIDGGALQGIGPPHHTGKIAYPISSLAVGEHEIVAEFLPENADYIGSVSPSIQQTVT